MAMIATNTPEILRELPDTECHQTLETGFRSFRYIEHLDRKVGGEMAGKSNDDRLDRIGPYELLGYLGRGGQGIVYKGRHLDGRLVAIKRLNAVAVEDEVARSRFLREAEATRRVAGFCTAQVIATDVDDEGPYIVSEYIEGESLQKVVERDGPRTGAQMERLMVGTLAALVAIHQAKVVHRDFKPTNVLLSPDGPRVVDFGVARMLDEGATASGPVGTPAYMAPEQFEGVVGPPADLFAWAASMYYAATGKVAFGSGSTPSIMYRVLSTEPDMDALPPHLRQILARCLQKDPARRPDATSLLLALLGGANAEVQEANATVSGPSRPVSRRQALTALGGAAMLGGAAAWTLKGRSGEPSRRAGENKPDGPLVLKGHNAMISGVCFGELAAESVVVSVSDDQTVRVWDPAAGRQIGPSLAGHKGWIASVAFAECDGIPMAVTVGDDQMVRLWDLRKMKRRSDLAGHRGWLRTVATGHFDGGPIAVTGGYDRTVRIWDLRSGLEKGKAIRWVGQIVGAVSLAIRDQRHVVVIGDSQGDLRMADLETREQAGVTIQAHDAQINTVACGEYDGHWVVFTAGDDMVVRGWDIDTGELRWLFKGHSQIVYGVQLGILNDRNVAVSAADDGTIRIWDLAAEAPYCEPLVGHRGGVRALAMGLVDGATCLATGSQDQSVRIWRPAKPGGPTTSRE